MLILSGREELKELFCSAQRLAPWEERSQARALRSTQQPCCLSRASMGTQKAQQASSLQISKIDVTSHDSSTLCQLLLQRRPASHECLK